jgi:hypothetical protein
MPIKSVTLEKLERIMKDAANPSKPSANNEQTWGISQSQEGNVMTL